MPKKVKNGKPPTEASYRSKHFDYTRDYPNLDLRKHPELYRVGRGEQGVLLVEPYKSELLPLWRFKTPAIAQKSARELKKQFLTHVKSKDFVGMDMARKFIQMGFTRARRSANHASGRKYDSKGRVRPRVEDPSKAESAAIFFRAWKAVEKNSVYGTAKAAHKRKWG